MSDTLLHIGIEKIFADPTQPRKSFDPEELGKIARSLKTRGMLQPIRVVHDASRGAYRVVVGESRLRAARQAGITEIPAIVIDGQPDDASLLADRLIENVCRSDLKPMELARGILLLKRLRKCTSQDAAAELGLSGSTICRAEALLKLPEDVQAMVDDGRLADSVAYMVSRLDGEDAMREVANTVARCRLNRDQAIELCKEKGLESKGSKPPAARLHGKAEGVAFSFSFKTGQLTADVLGKALDEIRAKVRELSKDAAKGKDAAALAAVLRAS